MIASESPLGISPINWLAGIAFVVVCVIVVFKRLAKAGSLDQQVWPSIGAGFGAVALVKAAYPIYLFVRYWSVDGVDDLWLYVYGGSVAGFFLGVDVINKAWNVKPNPTAR